MIILLLNSGDCYVKISFSQKIYLLAEYATEALDNYAMQFGVNDYSFLETPGYLSYTLGLGFDFEIDLNRNCKSLNRSTMGAGP